MQSPLARALAAALDEIAGVRTPAPGAQPVPAAVLVCLDAPPELAAPAQALDQILVVLTRRRAGLRRHAGEISFPGGRWEASDGTLYETALREVDEEIGLSADDVAPLGALDAVPTIATNYVIYPFVGLVELGARGVAEAAMEDPSLAPRPRWQTSTYEVDEVLELSLGEIWAGRGRTQLERRGFRFETDTFTVGEHLIWGATFRILEDLLARIGATGG
jgi:8-oxo-dGTP pyrophosphatase MutT (NUDIX family)